MLCVLPILLALGSSIEDPPDRPIVAPPRAPYSFVTFGSDVLERSRLIVEASAKSVMRAGQGVVVARFEVADTILGEARGGSVTVLAPPGEFRAGVKYILFLEPFEDGPRFRAMRRIVEGDRDYAAKKRVLRQFAQLHAITDVDQRAQKIRDTLIKNLTDDELFVRWNALSELKAFAVKNRQVFERQHRARLVAIYRDAPTPTFARAVHGILKELGVDLEGSGEPR